MSYRPRDAPHASKDTLRPSNTFQCEVDAKAFAKRRLADALDIMAGYPQSAPAERVIGSDRLIDWLNENGSEPNP